MIIENNRVVSVSYSLHIPEEEDGTGEEMVEQTTAENPYVFLFGSSGLIEQFESNLAGKKMGDAFDFFISASQAYGDYDEDKMVDIPIEAFKGEDGELDTEMVQIGNELPMVDTDGNRLLGIVEEVTDKVVRMDFNHPLAGNDLHFTGYVINIREATQEEISHGHVHGQGGHHH
jgi:FKBP-type peptidyl-prolyl cis-trans isomerase SlyD